MGRKVQVRPSYRQDAQFLIRLAQACEQDERQSARWRREVTGHLDAVAQAFLSARTDEDGDGEQPAVSLSTHKGKRK